jgi:hypothetical protein
MPHPIEEIDILLALPRKASFLISFMAALDNLFLNLQKVE